MTLEKLEKNTGNGICQRDLNYFKSKDIKEAVIKLRNKLTIEKYNQYVKDQCFMGSFEDYIQVRFILDIGDFIET